MKKRIGCLLLALMFCLGLTACDGEEKPSASEDPVTTTTAPAVTTTAASQADAPATTTTSTTEEASTTAPTTTDGPTICPTQAVPIAVPSPLADIGIAEIALYDPQQFQMEEAVSVKTLTDAAEVATVGQRLSAATWEYYPTQDKWVKFYPYFAEWALVLTCTDGRQRVLHLFSAEVGWASLGTFDGGLTYADIIEQAKAHSGDGSADFERYFNRYKIDGETLAYLLALFDA